MKCMSNWIPALVVLLLLTQLVECARAGDDWDTTDKVLGAATAAAIIMDCHQTRTIVRNPNRYREDWNPVLEKHPSMNSLNLACGTMLIGGYFLADAFPQWRRAGLISVLAIEIIAIGHNKRIGINLSF